MTHIKSFKSFLRESTFLGVVKNKLTGVELHAHAAELSDKDGNRTNKMVHLKDPNTGKVLHKFNNNKEVSQKYDYTRFASKNEAIENVEEDLDKDSKEYLKDKLEVAKSRAKYGNFYDPKSFNKYSKQQYKKLDNSQFESVEELDEGFTTHKPESYTSDLEGSITPIHKAKLSLLKGFDTTEDKDGYSPTHMIKCTKTGSLHTAYTRNGELRVRPYGKVSSGVTADLVKHLSSGITKDKTSRE